MEAKDEIHWTILHGKKPVGAVWVDTESTNHLEAPAVHIMIGDIAMRGKGLGKIVIELVYQYLKGKGYEKIYSRHLMMNRSAGRLLLKLGFIKDGKVYTDKDGLVWQNVVNDHK